MSTHAALQECPCISGSAKKFSQGPDLVTRELESLRSCRPSQIIRLHSVVTSARGFKECFNEHKPTQRVYLCIYGTLFQFTEITGNYASIVIVPGERSRRTRK